MCCLFMRINKQALGRPAIPANNGINMAYGAFLVVYRRSS